MASIKLEERTLIFTDDKGNVSSVDLALVKGDRGCRGPQGKCGIILDANGNIITEGLATEEYVNEKIVEAQIGCVADFDSLATEAEVREMIAAAIPPLAEEVDY